MDDEEPDMPWTTERYTTSMKYLPPVVREKAIEIANALLDEGHPEGQSIRIGIAHAKVWAKRRGLLETAAEHHG
jgi:uncharacterized protein YdaT